MRALVVCMFLSIIAGPASARQRAVTAPANAPRRIMWIAAHPDDEVLVAPLLATWCRQPAARCALLILSRGETGDCLLPGGCRPDLATVRSAEAAAAAQLFGAELTLLTLPDGKGAEWLGTTPNLVTSLRHHIEAFAPDTIITFDPRHGTTCHPDHRAAGSLVLDAVAQLGAKPSVELLETRVTVAKDPFTLHFGSATATATRYDAAPQWDVMIEDARRHPSQFDEQWLSALRSTPQSERAIYIAAAEQVLHDSVSGCE